MQTADFDYHDFQRSKQSELDKTLLVKFRIHPVQNKLKSDEAGRPIFEDKEYIDIRIPGNRSAGASRPVTKDDIKRFPEHYRKFKERVEVSTDEGTPLLEWGLCSRSVAEELAFFHVKTVEQLATMSDMQAMKFMGLTALREKAQKWLEYKAQEKPLWEADQRQRALKAEIESLKATVQTLVEQLESKDDDTLTEKQRSRGRQRAVKSAVEKIGD